jgi:hypothetical protein
MQPIIAPHGRLPIMPLHSSKAASRRLAVLQPRLPPQRSSSNGGGGGGPGSSYIITNSPLSGLSPQTLRSLAPLGRSPPSSTLHGGGPRGPSGVSPRNASLLTHHSPVSPKTLARLPLRALMRGGGHSGGGGHGSNGTLRAMAVSLVALKPARSTLRHFGTSLVASACLHVANRSKWRILHRH